MTPEADQILRVSAAQLMAHLAPLLPEGYAQGHAMVLSLMLNMSAQEYDRAAEIRARENDDMRALFGALAPQVDDTLLRAEIRAAAATRDESLAISALNKSNADLRRLLIRLQEHVESRGNKAAEAHIWEVLRRMAERRLVKLA
jgi:hypothetical protein